MMKNYWPDWKVYSTLRLARFLAWTGIASSVIAMLLAVLAR